MKNKFLFPLLLVVVCSKSFASGQSEYCAHLMAEVSEIKDLKSEFNAEGSKIVKAYYKQLKKMAQVAAQSLNLKERVLALQDAILQSGQSHFNGWKVTELETERGHLKGFKYYELIGDHSLLKSFTNNFSKTRVLLLTHGQRAVVLTIGMSGKEAVAAEVITVFNARKKFSQRYILGVNLGDREYSREELDELDDVSTKALSDKMKAMSDEKRQELRASIQKLFRQLESGVTATRSENENKDDDSTASVFNRGRYTEDGHGTIEAVAMVHDTLAQLEVAAEPFARASGEAMFEWYTFNNQYLRLAGQINLREIINELVALHKKQQELRHDRRVRSLFYYDDRANLNVREKVKVPSGMMTAREGGQLLNILGYVDIRIVVDVPRPGEDTVRLHIWDDRNQQWHEEYVLPLSENAPAPLGATLGSSSFWLPMIYGRLVEALEQMQERQEELENPEE